MLVTGKGVFEAPHYIFYVLLNSAEDIQQGSTAATMSMPMFKNLGPERPDYSYDFNPWDVLGLDLVYHTRITIIEQSQAYHTANLPAAR